MKIKTKNMSIVTGKGTSGDAEFSVLITGSTTEELDDNILRLACDIRERREAARKQRVVDYMRGKGGRV